MKKEKINGLDLIRLYGIGLILLYHIFRGFLPGGFIGVNIMFVLSGFLVTFHLLGEIYEKGSIDLSSYYKKRFLRIFPGLFFMILTVSILAIFINKDYTVDFFDQFLASFSFTTNYYEILSGGSYEAQFVDHLFVHTWFLAIEVHFYIIWPLLISFLYRLMSKAKNRIKTFSKYFLLINLALFGLTSLLTIGITLVGFLLSFGGFKQLVSLFYPIIGYTGMVLLTVLVLSYFREKESINVEMKKRYAISHFMRKKLDDDKVYTRKDKKKLEKLVDSSIIDNEVIKEKAEETVKEAIENESDDQD